MSMCKYLYLSKGSLVNAKQARKEPLDVLTRTEMHEAFDYLLTSTIAAGRCVGDSNEQ